MRQNRPPPCQNPRDPESGRYTYYSFPAFTEGDRPEPQQSGTPESMNPPVCNLITASTSSDRHPLIRKMLFTTNIIKSHATYQTLSQSNHTDEDVEQGLVLPISERQSYPPAWLPALYYGFFLLFTILDLDILLNPKGPGDPKICVLQGAGTLTIVCAVTTTFFHALFVRWGCITSDLVYRAKYFQEHRNELSEPPAEYDRGSLVVVKGGQGSERRRAAVVCVMRFIAYLVLAVMGVALPLALPLGALVFHLMRLASACGLILK